MAPSADESKQAAADRGHSNEGNFENIRLSTRIATTHNFNSKILAKHEKAYTSIM
jgi:hypothetical protein